MKQIALSIKQMKHLEELGLDTNDASMWWNCTYPKHLLITPQDLDELDWDNVKKEGGYPTYSLQDILEKLPQRLHLIEGSANLDDEAFMTFNKMAGGGWFLAYEQDDDNMKHIVMHGKQQNDSLLEAAYNMLCWCIENKYIYPLKKKRNG